MVWVGINDEPTKPVLNWWDSSLNNYLLEDYLSGEEYDTEDNTANARVAKLNVGDAGPVQILPSCVRKSSFHFLPWEPTGGNVWQVMATGGMLDLPSGFSGRCNWVFGVRNGSEIRPGSAFGTIDTDILWRQYLCFHRCYRHFTMKYCRVSRSFIGLWWL